MQRRSKGAGHLQYRETSDIDHQRRPAAKPVGESAKEKRAYGPKGQREKNGLEYRWHRSVKILGNRRHAEDQNEEIESIQ